MSISDVRTVCQTSALVLVGTLMSNTSLAEVNITGAFASERAAAVHFVKPLFPLMDCETVGVAGKGEVEEHFFELFYVFAQRRSFSFGPDDFRSALPDSSNEQVTTLFSLIDRDGDGAVSTQEFRTFMNRAIDLIDSDHNGQVTLADLGLNAPRIIRADQR